MTLVELAAEHAAAPGEATAPALRFVALGDSITVELGDGISMGAKGSGGAAVGVNAARGWAAALAPCLGAPGTPSAAFTNLATTGARVRDVRARQLPAALACRPHVASVLAGMNDVIRGDFDEGGITADLAETVHALRATGATVLLARVHDPGVLFRIPRALRRALLVRIQVLNDAVVALALGDPGVLLLDLPSHPECYARTTWDVDRIHPGPRGHLLIARGFADLLAAAGEPVRRLPEPGPPGRAPSAAAHAWWLTSRGLPWLVLRSTGVWTGLGPLLRRPRGATVRSRASATVGDVTPAGREHRPHAARP
jgi:lysophospholipase L1-like esterase